MQLAQQMHANATDEKSLVDAEKCLEIADIYVVNKAETPSAERLAAELDRTTAAALYCLM